MAISSTPVKVELKKQINLLQAVAIIVGIIIGSGIFVSPVGILQNVGSVGLSLLMWLICGIFATVLALCYAEMGTTVQIPGGEYAYVLEAFGRFPAFACLWIECLIVCPVGISATSLVFATYILQTVFPSCQPPVLGVQLVSSLLILLLFAINMRDVSWATQIQVIVTGSKLVALGMIIIIGVIWLTKGHYNFLEPFSGSVLTGETFVLSIYSGFWAYSGWGCLNLLTVEMVEPNKNLPRAIIISMALVTLLYLVVNAAYFAVLSNSEIVRSSAVAVIFLEQSLPAISWLMPILIAISVSGSINGMVLSLSRLYWAGAVNGQFPALFKMIDVERLTPTPALFLLLILSLILQIPGDIFFLIEMSGFAETALAAVVLTGQVYLRLTKPNLPRPIKLPLFLPIVLAILCLTITAVTVSHRPLESAGCLAVILSSFPAYILCIKWHNKPKSFRRFYDKFTVFFQKLLLVTVSDS